MRIVLIVGAVLVAFGLAQVLHLSTVLAWGTARTRGLAYYGLAPARRAGFKRRLRIHARLLSPIIWILARRSRFTFAKASFRYRGIAGPRGTCSPKSFALAEAYLPTGADIFVVTQMKCGTTWMQHVVYETLHRGAGHLVPSGQTLYQVSPWLEAETSVSVSDAPLLGAERPSRLIKTHLPVTHCPWSPDARYIYVARHPVSCFASCADFVTANAGRMAPEVGAIEEWFMSPEWMWWGTWPDHVAGWWQRTQEAGNVLFVHFEDMKTDLEGVVRQVAESLGVRPLMPEELEAVIAKCGFAYMQRHGEAFEMHPPHLLAVDAELFVRGSAERYRDVPPDRRRRIGAWAREALAGSTYPFDGRYPDLSRDP